MFRGNRNEIFENCMFNDLQPLSVCEDRYPDTNGTSYFIFCLKNNEISHSTNLLQTSWI